MGKTCGVLTVLMSKTLDNINVDWHNLILSRLCTLDTCAIGDKILSTDCSSVVESGMHKPPRAKTFYDKNFGE